MVQLTQRDRLHLVGTAGHALFNALVLKQDFNPVHRAVQHAEGRGRGRGRSSGRPSPPRPAGASVGRACMVDSLLSGCVTGTRCCIAVR